MMNKVIITIAFSFFMAITNTAFADACAYPSTDFSEQDVTMITSFQVDADCGKADFDGGYVGVPEQDYLNLNGTKSWIILPKGNTEKGTSTGEGLIQITGGHTYGFSLKIGTDENTKARLQLLNSSGIKISDDLLISQGILEVIEDIPQHVKQFKILIDEGDGQVVIDQFSVDYFIYESLGCDVASQCKENDVSSGSINFLMFFALLLFGIKRKYY